jgi:NAD(P)-dependent dehydrogenase (short-subunit alcohol dehydrogenase family)
MVLAGRNALVTGGAHRLGAAIVRALAAGGANVFIHYFSSAEAASALAAELGGGEISAATGQADLSDPAVAPLLIDAATDALGPLSILVNSASTFPTDTLADATLETWHATLDCTLAAPVFLTQSFARALPEGLDGAVVNVTDARTQSPYKKHFTYAVAKGGLEAFTRAAAVGLGPAVRVNGVAPGVVLPPWGEGEGYVERLATTLPLGRPGGAEPVAQAVRALLENDFVTGEIVRVDGGGHLTTAVASA